MGVKSKSVTVRGAARKHAAKAAGGRGRRRPGASEAWEQTAQLSEERNDGIDCQRIVERGSRTPYRYYDDYN
jgi:hypothetical protein